MLYVAVTCGPALLSSRPYLRCFGLLSLLGLVATAIVRADELTSLWCVYVALVSVLILEHFRRQRASEAHDGSGHSIAAHWRRRRSPRAGCSEATHEIRPSRCARKSRTPA